jgi:predicted RNA-binding Zn ribbon-like protein
MADPAAAQEVLAAALALRESAYAVLLGSRSASDFSVVAAHASTARAVATLRRSKPGAVPLARWTLSVDGVNAPLLGVAAQLDDLLSSPLSSVVAACPGVGCGWLFADARQRRRWCDMAVCGNRAKARRHAQRLAASRDVN